MTRTGVSILVLTNQGEAPDAQPAINGANLVLAMPTDPAQLAPHVSQLLNVEHRTAYRIVLSMAVEGVHNNKPFLCNSMNISTRGMLIRTTEVMSPGNHATCSFYLPDGSRINASGDIARILEREPGSPFNQYGLRFIDLAPGAESAITAFVKNNAQQDL